MNIYDHAQFANLTLMSVIDDMCKTGHIRNKRNMLNHAPGQGSISLRFSLDRALTKRPWPKGLTGKNVINKIGRCIQTMFSSSTRRHNADTARACIKIENWSVYDVRRTPACVHAGSQRSRRNFVTRKTQFCYRNYFTWCHNNYN